MALLAVLSAAALAGLPEELKAHYVEKKDGPHAGSFFLDVSQAELTDKAGKKSVFALEDIHGLRTALQKEREGKSEAEKIVKAFEGMDAAEAKAAIEKIKALGDNAPDSEAHKAAMESLKKQLETKYTAEIDGVKKIAQSYEQQLERVLVDQAAMTALSKHKLMDGGAELLMPHIKSRIKVVKNDDGSFVARVLDKDGGVRVSLKPGNNGPMDVEELVDSMSKEKIFGVAFQGTGNSGTKKKETAEGGGKQPPAEGGGKQPDNFATLHRQVDNPAQRIAEARERMAGQTG